MKRCSRCGKLRIQASSSATTCPACRNEVDDSGPSSLDIGAVSAFASSESANDSYSPPDSSSDSSSSFDGGGGDSGGGGSSDSW